jgi:hypothetical protein
MGQPVVSQLAVDRNTMGVPNVNPIYRGAGVCDPEGAGSGQLHGLSQC